VITPPSAAPVRRYVEHVMGMPVSLALRGRHIDDAAARGAWAQAVATLHDVDRVFSTYKPASVVSRLARGELTVAGCPPEVAEVLALGEAARVASRGAFDVRRSSNGTVVFDPSGVVKGWAADRAVGPLRLLPDTDVCLSVGGDVICHVADPDAAPWRIGVEDPHDPTRVLAVVPVRRGAVATSGLAHRGAHVVDARSGRVPAAVASVTVVASDLTRADLDATSALALDTDALPWLLTRRGRSGVMVWADGRREVFGGAPTEGSTRAGTAGTTAACGSSAG
jgi:thiamine biosynthesis lipoprotein